MRLPLTRASEQASGMRHAASHAHREPRQFLMLVGMFIVGCFVLIGLLSLVWTPYSPAEINPGNTFDLPSLQHLLGTDQFGRDVLSRMMQGAQTDVWVGVITVAVSSVLGVPLGGIALILGGWAEEAIMRICDVVYAFPAVLLAIVIGASLGVGLRNVMLAVGLAYVPVFARVTRGSGKQVMEYDFVTAAAVYGRSRTQILVKHVLPNIRGVLIVQATVMFALAILAEAALSYLGLGVQSPRASWGAMLHDGQTLTSISPGLAIWPGVAIVFAVIGFNLLGDGLRDHFDPHIRRERS